ncbi:hypothetical protein ACFLQR_05135 [Verrucomicrobiota bacterium]
MNGGENVNVMEGDIFDIREEKRPITDPSTGNVINWKAGKIVGRIRITRVHATSADGVLLSGEAKRGNFLERVEKKGPQKSVSERNTRTLLQ